MDRPKCPICGAETQWYGWLHGWICMSCNGEELDDETEEDVLEQPQHDDYKQKNLNPYKNVKVSY